MTGVTFLSGGTGTPKLLDGARDVVSPDAVTVVCNTADDVVVGGNLVCPDLDTVLYTLSDVIDREHWWGVAGDGTVTHGRVRSLLGFGAGDDRTAADGDDAGAAADDGGDDGDGDAPAVEPRAVDAHRPLGRHRTLVGAERYMTVGDRDRALHVARTELLDAGRSLTAATRALADRLAIRADVLPMTDDPVASWIATPDGPMHFQEWLLRHGAEPSVEDVTFRGTEDAATTDAVLDALRDDPVVIGPSNPVTSVGPMLALPGVEDALAATRVVAVSPFVGDDVVSGPAATLMRATGLEASHRGVAARYAGFLDALVVDEASADALASAVDCDVVGADTVMSGRGDAARLYRAVVELL